MQWPQTWMLCVIKLTFIRVAVLYRHAEVMRKIIETVADGGSDLQVYVYPLCLLHTVWLPFKQRLSVFNVLNSLIIFPFNFIFQCYISLVLYCFHRCSIIKWNKIKKYLNAHGWVWSQGKGEGGGQKEPDKQIKSRRMRWRNPHVFESTWDLLFTRRLTCHIHLFKCNCV